MMKKIIFLLIIIASGFGCKKENSYNFSSSLVGKWSWLISCGGVAGCWTPVSTRTTVNLVFSSDSIYSYYKNDTLKGSIRYSTYKLISVDRKDTSLGIKLGSVSYTYSIYHDTLTLNSLEFFNAGSSYERIK
jgi:hypothetical protein